MPSGVRYNIHYSHQRKEVTVILQIGTTPPVEYIFSAEGFLADIDYISKSKGLSEYIDLIRNRKDLPTDHDFGEQGGHLKFNPQEWENKPEGDNERQA